MLALAPLPLEATPLQSLSPVHVFLCALKEEWDQLIKQRDALDVSLKTKALLFVVIEVCACSYFC